MGLDQYLRVKTSLPEYTYDGATGACSGLFPLAPEDNNMYEIGYLRKGFAQNNIILSNVLPYKGDWNCENLRIDLQGINNVLESAEKYLKHKYDEDGYDMEDYDGTFNSYYKWTEVKRMFTEAKEIIEKDPNAEVYYCVWE